MKTILKLAAMAAIVLLLVIAGACASKPAGDSGSPTPSTAPAGSAASSAAAPASAAKWVAPDWLAKKQIPQTVWLTKADWADPSIFHPLGTENTGPLVTCELDVVPLTNDQGEDCVIGFAPCKTQVLRYNWTFGTVHIKTNIFEAINFDHYAAVTNIKGIAWKFYHVRFVFDFTKKLYNVFVSMNGEAEKQLARDYKFRKIMPEVGQMEQSDLGQMVCYSESGDDVYFILPDSVRVTVGDKVTYPLAK